MAKKRGPGRPKGSGKKKNAQKKSSGANKFWRQVFAIVLILLALLFFVGLINIGGTFPVGLGEVLKMLFGYAAWFIPFILVIISIKIFASEDNEVSGTTWFCATLFLVFWSALFQLMAVDPLTAAQSNFEGPGGGIIGWFMDYWFLRVMSPGVLAVIYVFLILIVAMFLFSLSPKDIFRRIGEFFSRENKTEENNRRTVQNLARADARNADFKVNGISQDDTEETLPRAKPKKSSLFGGAKKSEPKPVQANVEPIVEEPKTVTDNSNWQYPSVDLLANTPYKPEAGNMKKNAELIEQTLEEFNIIGTVEGANVGPRVTQYLLRPQAGVKMSKISGLEDELKRNLMVKSIRIEAPIPGQSYVGIEIPNAKPAFVSMRSILESPEWEEPHSPLPFAVGLDVSGKPIVSSLSALPHLLVAGTTGSGKSVMMNVIITSLLFKHTPDDLKMIMIDPKGNEMVQYIDMPHLIAPIISGVSQEEIAKCIKTLHWTVEEMGRRYDEFRDKGVRDIKDFKKKYPDEKMPYLAVFIDEWTSLMDSAKSTEREYITTAVQQLAQKGRAAGIDEVIMMQAPRAKYLPGSIKANIPAGFAFAVLNKMESQQIINQSGGEQLMGKGDMLMKTQEIKEPIRVQAAVVGDNEVARIVDFIKEQSGPQYDEALMEILAQEPASAGSSSGNVAAGGSDYQRAVEIIVAAQKGSTSLLERRMGIGYGKAAKLLDQMEADGIVSPPNGNRPRTVLVNSTDIEVKD